MLKRAESYKYESNVSSVLLRASRTFKCYFMPEVSFTKELILVFSILLDAQEFGYGIWGVLIWMDGLLQIELGTHEILYSVPG